MNIEKFETNFLDLMNGMFPRKAGVNLQQQSTKEGFYFTRLSGFKPETLRRVAERWCSAKENKGWPSIEEAEVRCLEIEPREAPLVENYQTKEQARHEATENAVMAFTASEAYRDFPGNKWELRQRAMNSASIQAQAVYGTGLPSGFGYDHAKTPFDVHSRETKEQNLKLAWQWANRTFEEAQKRGNILVSFNRYELEVLADRAKPVEIESNEILGLKRME